ncbi:hypothetical protein PPACK8108_LOCUS12442 [Phakopsora pachyrhizi]|uniref:Uncharacterized protein n=1 Tax=Phakopsora pachyrhizi TaxID=170000 RepID=A0AAV0B4U8_PHAPC|nr:hypothetical protein PPACK8108_LOCUS12442 [Phakopsora pachyrhizi]
MTGVLIEKFDLNELPKDVDSAVDNNQVKMLSEIGNEIDPIQASKRQRLRPTGQHLIPETAQSSKVITKVCSQEISSNQVTTGIKLSLDRSLPAHQSLNDEPNNNIELLNLSKIQSKNFLSPVQKVHTNEKTVQIGKLNHKPEEPKNQNPQSMIQKYANPIASGKFITTNTLESLTNIKNNIHLKSGPFDLLGERSNKSPYNNQLLQFVEKNLSDIVHESLKVFEIDKNFLETVKTLLWSDNEGILCKTEDIILDVIDNFNRHYYDGTGHNWIKYSSANKNVSLESKPASQKFKFREVFSKVLTYENYSRFFFTDNMRLSCDLFFGDLERKLLNKKDEIPICGKSLSNFVERIWVGVVGFLAYVHAINAIMPPGSTLPITNYKLVEKQEEALNFFFRLHEDAQNFVGNYSERKTRKTYFDNDWKELSFEDKRKRALDEILNSNSPKDKRAWLYIELWMINYRPQLYQIATQKSTKGIFDNKNRFRSFVNKVCFPLFSGILKFKKLEG